MSVLKMIKINYDSKKYTMDSKPIVIIKKVYTMGNIEVPMELKVDFTDIPKNQHQLALQLAQSII